MVATIKEVAGVAGLSVTTVSKYLNGGNVEPENRVAVENAIRETGYIPNAVARNLRMTHTHIVGVIMPWLDSMFAAMIIGSMDEYLQRHGYNVLIFDCRGSRESEREKLDFLVNQRVDGAVLISSSLGAADFTSLDQFGIPVVLLDNPVPGYETDTVLINNAEATEHAVDHLFNNGHDRIAVICSREGLFTSDERLRGYKAAYEKHGLTPDPSLMLHGEYTIEHSFNIVTELMKRPAPPTALLSTNYDITMGTVMALNKLGIEIGRDISVVGFDCLNISEIIRPPLTAIRQPMREIGRAAAKLLLRRIHKEDADYPRIERMEAIFEINESVVDRRKRGKE